MNLFCCWVWFFAGTQLTVQWSNIRLHNNTVGNVSDISLNVFVNCCKINVFNQTFLDIAVTSFCGVILFKTVGPFSFQCTLHSNGTIWFAYKQVSNSCAICTEV